jgi:hypothetical protein
MAEAAIPAAMTMPESRVNALGIARVAVRATWQRWRDLREEVAKRTPRRVLIQVIFTMVAAMGLGFGS